MGILGCSTKGGDEGVFLQAQKSELSPSVGYQPDQKVESTCPSPDHRPHIGKNGFLINFTKNFACGVYFQLHSHD